MGNCVLALRHVKHQMKRYLTEVKLTIFTQLLVARCTSILSFFCSYSDHFSKDNECDRMCFEIEFIRHRILFSLLI